MAAREPLLRQRDSTCAPDARVAARRICDSLRTAGVEVWFDQNELAGGDSWDAKIRGQIGSRALFILLRPSVYSNYPASTFS